MELKIMPGEMDRILLKAGLITDGWHVVAVSRSTGVIPSIEVFIEKEEPKVVNSEMNDGMIKTQIAIKEAIVDGQENNSKTDG